MKKTITTLGLSVLVPLTAQAANIVFEDFEDSTITYTSSVADDLGDISSRDYFGRIAPDTSTPPADVTYSNPQGSGYYGAQDTDGALSGNIDLVTLNWTGINILNFDNLEISGFFAEDTANDSNEDWDTTSSVRLTYQIDGGGYQNLLAFESEIGGDGNATNEAPRVDTNFDGTGDGAALTDMFTKYTFNLGAATGTTMDIRIEIQDLDSGDEDVAFDNILLTGDLVPEPSSSALLGLGGLATLLRRRR